jgi:hypothetical protein
MTDIIDPFTARFAVGICILAVVAVFYVAIRCLDP